MTGMTHLLRYVAVLAFFTAPAHAQENPIFFGKWEPYSTSANMHGVHFEKGRLTYTSPYVERSVYDYHIIRDFGDRLLVRAVGIEGNLKGIELLQMFEFLVPNFPAYSGGYWILSVKSCEYQYVLPDLFLDKDPEVIWENLMDWSKTRPADRRFHDCALNAQGDPLPDSSWGGGEKYSKNKYDD